MNVRYSSSISFDLNYEALEEIVCVHVPVQVYTCVHACGGYGSTLGSFSVASSSWFLRLGFSLNLVLTILTRLADEQIP